MTNTPNNTDLPTGGTRPTTGQMPTLADVLDTWIEDVRADRPAPGTEEE